MNHHRVQFPNAAVVFRQSADPTYDHGVLEHREREALAKDIPHLFNGERQVGPTAGLVKVVNQKGCRLIVRAFGVGYLDRRSAFN
jgi:hypothetical protein